ncbi:MAG: hypothetical protein ACP5P4_01285 [Steroidobacteraceae bacterium]
MRLASLPFTDVFEFREDACRREPPCTMRWRLAVGAGATLSWRGDGGTDGRVSGLDDFGVAEQSPRRLALRGLTAGRLERQIGERLDTAH